MGTLEQVTKLLDAGYSKEEIAAMFAAETKTEPAPKAEPAAKADPAPKAEPDKLDLAIEKMEKLTESMTKQADAMAKLAIMNSQQPPKDSTNDFLAKIINPQLGKETI